MINITGERIKSV